MRAQYTFSSLVIMWAISSSLRFISSAISTTNSLRSFATRSTRRSAYSPSYTSPYTSSTSTTHSYSHTSLPEETLFILDGTAMLFKSYFSRENKGDYQDALMQPELVAKIIDDLAFTEEEINQLKVLYPHPNGDEDTVLIGCGTLIAMAMHFARFVRDVKPKYVAVTFDAGKDVLFRRDIYPEYKRNRPTPPIDIMPLFSLAPRIFSAFGCKCFKQKGYEADDLMATISRWGQIRGLSVVHVSNDKDMLQLIETGVHVMDPATRVITGTEEVRKKHGVPPSAFCDMQSLMGDAADNIPGVKGIGAKTASALVQHFGGIESMYAALHLHTVPPCPDELMLLSPTSKLVSAHLQELLGDKMPAAIAELEKALENASGKPATVLARLFMCGFANVTLYKYLITLRSDVKIRGLDSDEYLLDTKLQRASREITEDDVNRERNRYLEMVANDGNKARKIAVTSEDEGNEDDEDEEGHIYIDGLCVDTSFFRYRGEDRLTRTDVEAFLTSINPQLMKPLQLLRQQYHRLQRTE